MSTAMGARRAPEHIYMTVSDVQRLLALVKGYREQGRQDSTLDVLEEEIERALVIGAERPLPADVVTLDSRIAVVDLDSGEEKVFAVVLPSKADADAGRISVLAPLGTAVLGCRTGEEIEWDVPGGRRRLVVRRVLHQPEAAAARRSRRAEAQ